MRNDNVDPGKNNAFIQMIRQSEELWNEYKGLSYILPSKRKRHIEKLKKMVEKLKNINWEQEFQILEELYK